MKPLHRCLLYVVVALLFMSGAAWTYWGYFVVSLHDFEIGARAWAIKIHGAAAMAVLVLLGMLLTGHVRLAWRARRNRGNGSVLLSSFAILTVTGYGLYYAGGEALRAWASWIHIGVGFSLPLIVMVHIWLGRKSRPAIHAAKHVPSRAKIQIS